MASGAKLYVVRRRLYSFAFSWMPPVLPLPLPKQQGHVRRCHSVSYCDIQDEVIEVATNTLKDHRETIRSLAVRYRYLESNTYSRYIRSVTTHVSYNHGCASREAQRVHANRPSSLVIRKESCGSHILVLVRRQTAIAYTLVVQSQPQEAQGQRTFASSVYEAPPSELVVCSSFELCVSVSFLTAQQGGKLESVGARSRAKQVVSACEVYPKMLNTPA